MIEVVIRAPDVEVVRRLLREPHDFGCRPNVVQESDGRFRVRAVVRPELLAELQLRLDVEIVGPIVALGPSVEVERGNRFANAPEPPRGFGRKVRTPNP